jgi:AraC-like DNA-binding protein/mannose-6-phosphate isomerase-like protein (cupin superfamily)
MKKFFHFFAAQILSISLDTGPIILYNGFTMIINNLLLASESYTHTNWEFHNVNVRFSRLYYIIDGEAYYMENGQSVRFKKGHLYLTPVNTPFDLYENPSDKLLHTYVHIITLPEVTKFTEIEVVEGTPLADAVALWRKYARSEDYELISNIIQFLLSQIPGRFLSSDTVAERIKHYLDSVEGNELNTADMSHALGYTREHITRSFYSMYKTTPKRYFGARLMSIAAEKLYRGETIQSVAEQLNYSSPAAFSKAFKKHFGSSPIKYVNALKRNEPAVFIPSADKNVKS